MHGSDPAPFKSIKHRHEFLPGGLSLSRMRRRHEAVPASVIAFAGDAPLDLLLEAGIIIPVLLKGKKLLPRSRSPDDSVFLPLVIIESLFVGKGVKIDLRFAIAV